MTRDRAHKKIVRARMSETAEPYSEANRRIQGYYDAEIVGGAAEGASEPYLAARVSAAVLFTDEAGRVLLIRPQGKPGWTLPGRHLRHHEEPSYVSVAVVAEQLGINPSVGAMLVVDWSPDPDDGRFPDADKVVFVFDGGTLSPENIALIARTERRYPSTHSKSRPESGKRSLSGSPGGSRRRLPPAPTASRGTS
jgi:ADP-ribose pyrophosphatase YjhB (NUDIX family)